MTEIMNYHGQFAFAVKMSELVRARGLSSHDLLQRHQRRINRTALFTSLSAIECNAKER